MSRAYLDDIEAWEQGNWPSVAMPYHGIISHGFTRDEILNCLMKGLIKYRIMNDRDLEYEDAEDLLETWRLYDRDEGNFFDHIFTAENVEQDMDDLRHIILKSLQGNC